MKLFFSFILIIIYSAAIFGTVFYIGLWFAWGNAITVENLVTLSTILSILFFLYQMWKSYQYSNEEVEEKL